MILYLARHGDAKSRMEDPSKGLSDKGIEEVERVAGHLAGLNVRVERIFHSGKLRAMQTAQIMDDAIGTDYHITETDGLAPMDDPGIWYERICEMKYDCMLVGHLPYMSMLSALLLSRTQDNGFVEFETGGIACFERAEDCMWDLKWKTGPETVKK